MDKKELILDTITDMVSALLYYDRKEDDELPIGAIEEAVLSGIITKKEILNHFAEQLNFSAED
jgi:hypothetical protein